MVKVESTYRRRQEWDCSLEAAVSKEIQDKCGSSCRLRVFF
ncbi:hypothetical protein OESDEN_09931 [Oesophagostomum dentatum]|uniref:Uncharacterized protein n=1 Tax=Oesophagostomum dentatum TaxID=61180 RepID=A0A0B1SZ30_OESDE|nr:hypothetical protein OESDEN_09931 [Oesophagostomum dentatum]